MLHLVSGDSALLLCPEVGGAVARFRWRGRDILRPVAEWDLASGNARRLGMFPLLPYSNRVEDGLLHTRGGPRQLRLNVDGEIHSMHGFGWQRPWRVEWFTQDRAVLVLDHAGDADWPYPCHARQVISLVNDTLSSVLWLQNSGTEEMPAGLGFHPYFPRQADTCLQAGWSHVWTMNERKLPEELVPVPGESDFSDARPIEGWHSDHCYTGWNGEATLIYPTHRVEVSSEEDISRFVCFVPNDGRPIIALEPVTHVNNALALEASGVEDTGMRWLAPGEELRLSIAIAVRET
jgi:aldose 1-epimerase